MRRIQWLCALVLLATGSSFSTLSIGAEAERAWMTSACYKFNLTVWDKFSDEAAPAKFIITSSSGRIFVAERNATGDSNASEVVFPNDFHDAKLNVPAWIDCRYGEEFKWAIYINDVLKDSGTIGFTRNKRK